MLMDLTHYHYNKHKTCNKNKAAQSGPWISTFPKLISLFSFKWDAKEVAFEATSPISSFINTKAFDLRQNWSLGADFQLIAMHRVH